MAKSGNRVRHQRPDGGRIASVGVNGHVPGGKAGGAARGIQLGQRLRGRRAIA